MTVDYETVNMMDLGVGVDLKGPEKSLGRARVKPSGYLKYKYDFLNRGIKTRSTYNIPEDPDAVEEAPIVNLVTKGPEPQRSIINLGANLEAEMSEKWTLSLGYDFEYKEKFGAHSGHLNATREF